ncbi:uncharacterized protein BKA55DRAFT_561757 [Fusarium redolens]|uniref:Uncharacterized protein n=1 Tax=Fusarium redolens TaxID=48865 RepID=A0A9P9HJN8_FUSRE|nr:uncharacterized protein BKA55DRAFT_561757 [Fusarium redolens]KAH7258903.1 hypothetical protein BKA55DRAFT_561757 [Fusarium redolens]
MFCHRCYIQTCKYIIHIILPFYSSTMWNALLLLGATIQFALAQEGAFSCAKFWPGVKPGDSFTVGGQCRMLEGYPKTIGNTKVSVIYTEDWSTSAKLVDSLLHEAITESVAYYGNFATVPDLVIILGAAPNPKASLDASFPIPNGPCQIRSFEFWGAEQALKMDPKAMQGVAHEIYHCVQQEFNGGQTPPVGPSRWVVESSADYFSNLVFPRVNDEWSRAVHYDPGVPIWRNEYNANIWFQSLEPSHDLTYIHQFVTSTVFTNSENEERARLAAYATFADDFFEFAKSFTIGSIVDSGGGDVPRINTPDDIGIIWSVDEDATEGTAVLETSPFTIREFSTSFDPGQNIKLYASTTGNQRLAWRLVDPNTWNAFPSDASGGGSEGVITIPCASGPVAVFILFTSTEDKDTDKVEISFVQEYEDKECCKRRSGKGAGKKECSTTTVKRPRPTRRPRPASTAKGSCKGSKIPMDSCLKKSWSLDIPTTRKFMEDILTAIPHVTVKDVRVSGTAKLEFHGKQATFTYDGFTVAYVQTLLDRDTPVSVVVNGKATGVVSTASGGDGSGTLCLSFTKGSGTAEAKVPSLGVDTKFDLAPGGGYFSNGKATYTCQGDKMTLKPIGSPKTKNGVPSWGPYSYNAK